MNCKAIGKYLDAYIDGELDPGLLLDVNRHLEACDSCQAVVLIKRKMKSGLARLAEVKAPDHLRERIIRAERSPSRIRTIAIVAALPLAAAAALLLVIGLPSGQRPGESLAGLVDDVVARHTHELPMEVKGGDPTEAASWFRGKVDFPVQAPSLGLKEASFEGARLSNVREHQAAHMAYIVDGHRVTLMIFNRQHTPLVGGRQVSVKGKEVLLGTHNGFNVAVLLDGDLAYALSSDLSQDRLISLVGQIRR